MGSNEPIEPTIARALKYQGGMFLCHGKIDKNSGIALYGIDSTKSAMQLDNT